MFRVWACKSALLVARVNLTSDSHPTQNLAESDPFWSGNTRSTRTARFKSDVITQHRDLICTQTNPTCYKTQILRRTRICGQICPAIRSPELGTNLKRVRTHYSITRCGPTEPKPNWSSGLNSDPGNPNLHPENSSGSHTKSKSKRCFFKRQNLCKRCRPALKTLVHWQLFKRSRYTVS